MRIIQVQGLVGGGGSEVHTSILCRGLRERGHQVHLCMPDEDHWLESEVKSAGCTVARFPVVPTWRKLFDLDGGAWLANEAEQFEASVIHTHIWNADVLGYFARRRTGTPVVATLHGPTISVAVEKNLLHRLHHRIYAQMLKRLDRVIAISDFVRHFVADDLHIDAAGIDVVHNCSDVRRYRLAVDRDATRKRLGVPSDALVSTIVGELSPRKGILEFIRSAAIVSEELVTAHFLVVGEGVLREEASLLTERMGISDRVHFVGQRKDVAEILRSSDLLAVTSYKEGFGRTITEAMSSELPVVSFESGATGEIIVDGVTGYLTPEGDVEAFAHACLKLLRSVDLREEFGRAGLARAIEKFDVPTFVERTETVLREACGRNHGR